MDQTLTVAAPVTRRERIRGRRRDPRAGARTVRVVMVLGVVAVLGMWWLSVPPGFAATPADAMTSLGELSGMVGAFLICAQVLLIARVPWFENAVGLDRLVSWHRSLGASVVFLVVAHVLLLVIAGVGLWQLYPLLVHVVLFGGSYAASFERALSRYL